MLCPTTEQTCVNTVEVHTLDLTSEAKSIIGGSAVTICEQKPRT
jgi:hypothetical protein